MRVAVAQICTSGEVEANLELVRTCVENAAEARADLVVFPEATMCAFGHDLGAVAQPLDGAFADSVVELARHYDVHVVLGMFTPGEGHRVRNTLLITDGEMRQGYDKIHVFDAFGFRESDAVTPGDQPVTFECNGAQIGVATCYDVRFPQLFIQNARRGASVHLVSASWADGPGKADQWELLLRARALDSTSFVVASGQALPAESGVQAVPGAPTGIGHSAIVSPTGHVMATAGPSPELLIADLDLEDMTAARDAIPVLVNARLS